MHLFVAHIVILKKIEANFELIFQNCFINNNIRVFFIITIIIIIIFYEINSSLI